MQTSAPNHASRLAATLAGIAAPCIAFGKVAIAAPLLVAAPLLLTLPGRRGYWRALGEQARSPLGVMVLIMLALWLPNVVASIMPVRSLEAWARVPVFIAFATLLWAMLAEREDMLTLSLKALVTAAAVTTIFAIMSLTVLPTEALSLLRYKGWNPNTVRATSVFKEYASMAILLAPVLLWGGRRLGGRWWTVAAVTAVGLLVVIWLTAARAAMAGLLMMAFGGGIIVMATCRKLALNLAVGAVLIVVTLALLAWLHHSRGEFVPPEGVVVVLPSWLLDYQRQTIWAHAIEIAMKSPWIGNGINVINLLPMAQVKIPTNVLHVIPSHPHNWLLEVFAETGVFGAAALVAVVVGLNTKLVRDYLRHRDPVLLVALLVNIGYWGSGLLNFSFWSAWWQLSYLLMSAIALAGRSPLANH